MSHSNRQPDRVRGSLGRAATGLVAAVVLISGCKPQPPRETEAAEPPEPGKRVRNEELMKQVSALAGHAHVRLVWVEHRTRQEFDPFGEQANYRLVGFDSRDRGFRVLARKRDNYSRPLFTPDGSAVVFTERRWLEQRAGKTALQPSDRDGASLIKMLPWTGGGGFKDLAQGMAVSIWRDPVSKEDWVYCIDDNRVSSRKRAAAQVIYRFPLLDPTRRETVWQGTPLRTDNCHISRDGRVFAALFPWPEAGIADFQAKHWRKLDLGCWPALAPDDSRVTWVFDGGHKRLRLFDAEFKQFGHLDLREAPGMKGYPGFHPRWSNHPRFMVMTGPYVSKEKGRDALETGAGYAEVHLGKLKPDCSGFEGWVTVTSNSAGDFFPDAWIEGGEKALLGEFPQQTNKPLPPAAIRNWPIVPDGVEFVWSDAKAENKIPGRGTSCSLEARGIARNGRHFDLVLDGGWFEADTDATAGWLKGVSASASFFLQIMISEMGNGDLPSGGVPLLSAESGDEMRSLAVLRTPDGLRAEMMLATSSGPELWKDNLPTAALGSHRPIILALVWQDQRLHWYINGRLLRSSEGAPAKLPAFQEDLTWKFGSPAADPSARWWRAEKIIVASEARERGQVRAEAEAASAAASGRAELTPVRLKARVLAATSPQPERLDVYKRMLVDHTYEVVATTAGEPPVSERISVLHWAILDEKPVVGIPRKSGETVELLLAPVDLHPELESELTVSDQTDFSLPLYYDLTPPKIRQ